MLFKDFRDNNMVFHIKDISLSGMQLCYKDGTHNYKIGETLEGELHWKKASIKIKAKIQWIRPASLGVLFESTISFEEKMRTFLCYENIVAHIKPLHKTEIEMNLPNNLKFWLKADGALDLYVWEHSSQGISRFQILLMEHFIEWEEGVGLKTGKIITQKDLETPLSKQDEFLFEMDKNASLEKIEMALGVVRKISLEHLPRSAKDFLLYKLGGE